MSCQICTPFMGSPFTMIEFISNVCTVLYRNLERGVGGLISGGGGKGCTF